MKIDLDYYSSIDFMNTNFRKVDRTFKLSSIASQLLHSIDFINANFLEIDRTFKLRSIAEVLNGSGSQP